MTKLFASGICHSRESHRLKVTLFQSTSKGLSFNFTQSLHILAAWEPAAPQCPTPYQSLPHILLTNDNVLGSNQEQDTEIGRTWG